MGKASAAGYDSDMSDPVFLEYEYTFDPPIEIKFSLAKALAFTYVAACVAGLVVMGTVMALQV